MLGVPIVTQYFLYCDASDSPMTLFEVLVFDLLKFRVIPD